MRGRGFCQLLARQRGKKKETEWQRTSTEGELGDVIKVWDHQLKGVSTEVSRWSRKAEELKRGSRQEQNAVV